MPEELPGDPIHLNRDQMREADDGRIHLFGDPDEPAPCAFRFRVMPGHPGERPHHHAGFELGTVLDGEAWVAIGEPVTLRSPAFIARQERDARDGGRDQRPRVDRPRDRSATRLTRVTLAAWVAVSSSSF